MPESKEETLSEIERLEEWCTDMWEMLLTDGTVPDTHIKPYTMQVEAGQVRLEALKAKAKENAWTA